MAAADLGLWPDAELEVTAQMREKEIKGMN